MTCTHAKYMHGVWRDGPPDRSTVKEQKVSESGFCVGNHEEWDGKESVSPPPVMEC